MGLELGLVFEFIYNYLQSTKRYIFYKGLRLLFFSLARNFPIIFSEIGPREASLKKNFIASY